MSDQRALLDDCTNRPTCTAAMHMAGCPSSPTLHMLVALQRAVEAARKARRGDNAGQAMAPAPMVERQTWEHRVPGTDVPLTRIILDIDDHGRAYVHEALLGQLLIDAGWERAS